MKEDILKNLITILDNEIELYVQMKDHYVEKKHLLTENKILELSNIDTKIIENYETIKNLDLKRVNIIKLLEEDVPSMTKLIEVCKTGHCDKRIILKLTEQKERLASLSSEITLLNITNMKLIRHGIIINDKQLGTIINAFAPKGNSYSGEGKQISSESKMSTIIEDV